MGMKKWSWMIYTALLIPMVASATVKPAAEDVKRFFDYYDKGYQLGVLMVDHKLCLDIHNAGVNKNNCNGELVGNAIEIGKPVYIWMMFVVPAETKSESLLLQFNTGGLTRKVREVTVDGAFRFRVWKKVRFDKAGEWNVRLLQDTARGTAEVGTFNVNVTEAANTN